MKHLDIKYYYITDGLARKRIDEIKFCPTSDMTEDFPSKPPQGALFKKHRKIMMNWHKSKKAVQIS